ncbi:hypothetical protein H0H81_012368 [Sphagnurus paluster]|uniref:WLM domain-containing protein n=1 Tax=Sphagnurus paluster TaxID=117069 RepID=A0A9P7GGV4_9AGAR|nr:hypothetical protein H0H81_012368 [Sphagnurus paluster]
MVHHRLNEKESNPNPHINFITALPTHDETEHESARQLLRALAAQVRPIMKSHGFSVNSLEEYEHNNVFAGRNWNAGETVAGPHKGIRHMNHGPAFQALWKRLNAEVRALQDKGYYGDGYWSSGTRLADSEKVAGQGIEPGDLPEYMCGGAQSHARPIRTRTRGPRKLGNATTSTGRQTAKRRKAGTRVVSKTAFKGEGVSLSENLQEAGKGMGAGFGKRATSKRAREERALATERRLLVLQATASTSSPGNTQSKSECGSDEEAEDNIPETDSDRRTTLMKSGINEDLDGLKSGTLWQHFEEDFNFNTSQGQKSWEDRCDLLSTSSSTSTIPFYTSGIQDVIQYKIITNSPGE